MYLAQVITIGSATEARRLCDLLARRPELRLTVCPLATLEPAGLDALGDRVERCATADPLSLLPSLRSGEIRRLIAAHEARFGRASGFMPPQLAYSHHLAEIVADLGYRWILVDDRRTRLRSPEGGEMRCHLVEGVRDLAVFFCRRLPPRFTEGYVVTCGDLVETTVPTCTVSDLLRLFPERAGAHLYPRTFEEAS